jgi:hypothetical protein
MEVHADDVEPRPLVALRGTASSAEQVEQARLIPKLIFARDWRRREW